MFRRLIPVLLLHEGLLYKSIGFDDYTYIGDPINTVRIFNDKEVDELMILDVSASKLGQEPNYDLIQAMASEAFMPIAYGGGITSLAIAKKVIASGVEKVILNAAALMNLDIVKEIALFLGSSSTVVSVDCKKSFFGQFNVYNYFTKKSVNLSLVDYLQAIQNSGAGEIMLTSVSNDGKMKGYDLDLCKLANDAVHVPLIICGGAGNLTDVEKLFKACLNVSAAAGSMFVYYGKHKAVLITYPSYEDVKELVKIK